MKITSELADKCLICILKQIDHSLFYQKKKKKNHNLLLNVHFKNFDFTLETCLLICIEYISVYKVDKYNASL